MQYKMKPIETIFWLGTAGVLYIAANNIVKNVAKVTFALGGNRQSDSTLGMFTLVNHDTFFYVIDIITKV